MIRVIAVLDAASAHDLPASELTISLTTVYNWQGLSEVSQSRVFDIALVDLRQTSSCGDPTDWEAPLGILRPLMLPLVLVCDGSVHHFRLAVLLARHRSVEVAIRRDDGSVEGLEEAISTAASSSFGMQVAHRLLGAIPAKARSDILPIVEHLFLRPADFTESHATTRLGQVSVAVLNRRLRASGLLPFHILRRAARVALADRLATEYGLPMKQIVVRTGCGSIDTLEREVRRMTKISLKVLMRSTSEAELVDTLASCCLANNLTVATAQAII